MTSTEGQRDKNLTLQEQQGETLAKAMTENGKTVQKERQSSKIEKVKNAKQELKNDKNQVINEKHINEKKVNKKRLKNKNK